MDCLGWTENYSSFDCSGSDWFADFEDSADFENCSADFEDCSADFESHYSDLKKHSDSDWQNYSDCWHHSDSE